jgi:hypothetical protein
MKISSLNHRDIDILVAVSLLIASKFDEIDYNLPSFDYMKNTESLNQFWKGFEIEEFVAFEKFVLKVFGKCK